MLIPPCCRETLSRFPFELAGLQHEYLENARLHRFRKTASVRENLVTGRQSPLLLRGLCAKVWFCCCESQRDFSVQPPRLRVSVVKSSSVVAFGFAFPMTR